jgi:ketosteroid isomerase-like protein
MSAREIVAETLRRWAAQDVESAFEFVADDVVYVLYIDEDLAPFAGVRHGREAMMEAFYQMIEHYDYLKWEQVIVGAEGDVVRVQTQFRFHHRRTGTDLEGSMRTIITMRDGLMVRCEEFLDRGMVEAFMRLAQQREATNQIVHPPQIPPRRNPQGDTRVPVQMTADASDATPLEEDATEAGDKERCNS